MGGRGWMIICCASKFSHLCPTPFLSILSPLLFYLSSLLTHPSYLWPSPAVTRICREKNNLKSCQGIPRTPTALSYQDLKCSAVHLRMDFSWALYLYSLLQEADGIYPLWFLCFGENSNVCRWIVADTCGWILVWFSLVVEDRFALNTILTCYMRSLLKEFLATVNYMWTLGQMIDDNIDNYLPTQDRCQCNGFTTPWLNNLMVTVRAEWKKWFSDLFEWSNIDYLNSKNDLCICTKCYV